MGHLSRKDTSKTRKTIFCVTFITQKGPLLQKWDYSQEQRVIHLCGKQIASIHRRSL